MKDFNAFMFVSHAASDLNGEFTDLENLMEQGGDKAREIPFPCAIPDNIYKVFESQRPSLDRQPDPSKILSPRKIKVL